MTPSANAGLVRWVLVRGDDPASPRVELELPLTAYKQITAGTVIYEELNSCVRLAFDYDADSGKIINFVIDEYYEGRFLLSSGFKQLPPGTGDLLVPCPPTGRVISLSDREFLFTNQDENLERTSSIYVEALLTLESPLTNAGGRVNFKPFESSGDLLDRWTLITPDKLDITVFFMNLYPSGSVFTAERYFSGPTVEDLASGNYYLYGTPIPGPAPIDLKVTMNPNDPAQIVLTWSSIPGESYTVEFSNDLQLWTPLNNEEEGDASGTNTFLDALPGGPPFAGFYRVSQN